MSKKNLHMAKIKAATQEAATRRKLTTLQENAQGMKDEDDQSGSGEGRDRNSTRSGSSEDSATGSGNSTESENLPQDN